MDIKKLNSILMRTAAVLLMLVLVTSGMVSGRFARYVTTAEYSDSARVAKFHVVDNLNEAMKVNISADVYPGAPAEIPIEVTNHSEVAVRLDFMMENVTDNLPLTFEVLSGGTALSHTGTDPVTFTDTMAPGFNASKEYTLKINWTGDTSTELAGRVDLIRIALKVTQVD